MSGYIRPSILWHLARVGAADVATLARIIGRPKHSLSPVIRRMRAQQELADRPYSHGQLELTPKGLAAATGLNHVDVETAQHVGQLLAATRDQARHAEATEVARKLLNSAHLGTSSHMVVLEALLRAFEAVAIAHPCCTQAAAEAAMQVSLRLAHAAAEGRPADAPLH